MARRRRRRSEGARQAGERSLEQSALIKDFNRALIDAIPVSALIVNGNLRVQFANQKFYLRTRHSPASVLQRPIEHVLPAPILRGMKLELQVRQAIERHRVAKGTVGWRGYAYEYGIAPLLGGGDEALILFMDATREHFLAQEIRKIERHLTNVVESAGDLVFSADTRGRIHTWNVAASNTLGYLPGEVERKKTFASFCRGVDRPRVRRIFERLRKRRSAPSSYELVVPAKDGREVLLSWSFGVIQNDRGRPVGLVGVGRDLTERRRLEAQLLQSAKMASLGTMSSGMAHELRNPLAIASGAAQLLLKQAQDGLTRDCAERIYKAVHRASDIIENLLRFSHASGTQREPVDVSAALEETIALVKHQASLEHIRIEKAFGASLPCVVANKNRLQQVFMNLILNAIDATMKDRVRRLSLETSQANGKVIIRVADTGCGIRKDDLPRIFDPFFTTKAQERNTGLGLFISYGIVRECGGQIGVRSELGRGSTFTVTLPAAGGAPQHPSA